MHAPLISVVVPCFNGAEFLRPCLRSILRQRCDVEVIIVDDGSTDGSPAVARELALAHPGRVVFIGQANQGQAAARNLGIRVAGGTYLGFLDVDDEYADGFLKLASDLFASHKPIVAVQGRIEFVDLHRQVEPWQREAMESTMPGTILVRARIARQIGGFPVDQAFRGSVGGEDGCFRLQLAMFGDVAAVSQIALRYRVRRGSHFDYFLDRAVLKDGRVSFAQPSPQEADGGFARAMDVYREQVAVGMIERLSEMIQTEAMAGANFTAYQHAFGPLPGSIDPAEGFALYTLAKRWPVAGVSVEIGGAGGSSSCWLAAGCKASGAGKLVVLEPRQVATAAASAESIGAANTSLPATLARIGLNDAVEFSQDRAIDAVRTWHHPVRLLFIAPAPAARQRQILQSFSPVLARHGLAVIQGDPGNSELKKLIAELQQDPGKWKPVLAVLGLFAVESLKLPADGAC